MTDREQQLEDRIASLEDSVGEIRDMLRPIAETYRSVNQLGRWTMAVLIFISVLLGVLVGIKNL